MNMSFRTTPWMGTLLCVLALALTACGGGDEPPPPAQIGAAGGTAAGPNGAQVVVPAAALSANTAIAVTQSSSGNPAPPASHTAVGAVYAFTPHGQSFALPVTMTVPFDPALVPPGSAVKLFKTANGATGPWQEVPGATVAGNLISGSATSFSLLFAAVGNQAPSIQTGPANTAVVEPQSASFSVATNGTAPLAYQWLRSDGGATFAAIDGATASTYTTGATTVANDNGDRYRVVVSNLEGSAQSVDVMLTVTANAIAPTITTQPQNQSVAVGASATFAVVATGTSPAYQWQRSFDGGIVWTDIAAATNASYTLANAQTSDANAIYRARVSNAAGTVTSSTATLTVTAPPPPSAAARIAAGNNTSSAVTAAGALYTWGTYRGAGAPNTSSSTAAPITLPGVRTVARGSSTHGVAVRNDGAVWAWGYAGDVFCNFSGIIYHTPTQVTGAANIASASAGTGHTLLLSNTGVVYAFGCNGSGQLGLSSSIQSAATPVQVPGLPAGITAVAAGNTFSLALDGNGNVWAWGTVSLANGTPLINYGFAPVQVAGLSGIRALAAGENHALALKNDGSVMAWGSNSNGKLGDGSSANRLTPVPTLLTSGIKAVEASSEFSLALREADGVVLSWGINETGQLGSGSNSPGFRVTPAPVVGLNQVQAIAAGKTFSGGLGHALALRTDGTLWAWGWNMEGQLGNGSTLSSNTPVQVSGLNLN